MKTVTRNVTVCCVPAPVESDTGFSIAGNKEALFKEFI
jgi:hypothetical protein